VIHVSNVSKSFGKVPALRDVSLRIAPGERVAFVGSNGSGKTTLLRSILGLLRVEGRITIDGLDVAREPELALRGVAYIPQVAPPLDAPVGEVVRAQAALRGIDVARVASCAARLGLEFQALRATRFVELSGGMRQKLLAAMALATDARVVVCDEPTANLDAEARATFFQLIDERPREHVVILCSHRLEEVEKLVSRVIELREGRLSRDASLEELLADIRAYRVEVELTEADEGATRRLRSLGFEHAGALRFSAHLNHTEKLTVLSRLLHELEDEISDLSVTRVSDLPLHGERTHAAVRPLPIRVAS